MTPEEYLGRARAIAWQAAEYVSSARLYEVQRLIEHGEPAEGLCSLAWGIVNEQVVVPRTLIEGIREHTAELIDDGFMPTNLDDYMQNTEGSDHP